MAFKVFIMCSYLLTCFLKELCETGMMILHCVEVTFVKQSELECGPMPNVMVALPNIGGALCSTPQSLANAQY